MVYIAMLKEGRHLYNYLNEHRSCLTELLLVENILLEKLLKNNVCLFCLVHFKKQLN
jgi:hypothetical protein